MKTDESVRHLVVAAIRRHSMDLETWVPTRLCAAPDTALEVPSTVQLEAGELPLLFSCPGPTEWTFITTRRIWSCHEGQVESMSVMEIAQQDYGNFKGHGGQAVEQMTVTSRAGAVLQCPFETGKASMGVISAVGTLSRLRNEA